MEGGQDQAAAGAGEGPAVCWPPMRVPGRRRSATVLATVAALGGVGALAPVADAAGAPRALKHEGRWITDRQGRTVILHGWNMVNKLPPYRPAAVGFGRDDARFLRRHGFNTVRLGIIHKGLEPRPGTYDGRYLRSIKRTTRQLRRRGIQVLLDFHQDMYNERFNGEGEPDWAVVGDAATLPAVPDQGFPANYLIMPALWRAYDHFWANAAGPGGVGLQDRYAAAWRHVAKRFRKTRGVMGYNLFNEPWPGTLWPTCAQPLGCPLSDARLEAFHERVIAAIRRADRRRLVWYAPYLTFDFGADTHHGDTGDPRTGFAFNMYCLAFATRQILGDVADLGPLEDLGCDLGYDLALDNAEAQSAETGDALLLTEFGATDDLGVIERVLELADERMLSWQQWAYFNEDPSGERAEEGLVHDPARPPRGGNLKRDKLRVSERPYPQLTAGTPLRYAFDRAARRFEMTYSTEGPGGRDFAGSRRKTRIYVPRIHFGRRYRVDVSGARVVSRNGARILRLRNRRNAERVRLTIRR
jgi:endoglycosylceramidase